MVASKSLLRDAAINGANGNAQFKPGLSKSGAAAVIARPAGATTFTAQQIHLRDVIETHG
jgi:hypothetical protein